MTTALIAIAAVWLALLVCIVLHAFRTSPSTPAPSPYSDWARTRNPPHHES